ncbi:unnamed protein product [Aureobasidium mustum]|uniref:Uncharacterized protein n=1 Tax=Aureobasidium mustum TaxID=2773714 RepID=A0A9N8K6F9_9PEZI|nr:unnamed protein product [Aureobasidium mustum]
MSPIWKTTAAKKKILTAKQMKPIKRAKTTPIEKAFAGFKIFSRRLKPCRRIVNATPISRILRSSPKPWTRTISKGTVWNAQNLNRQRMRMSPVLCLISQARQVKKKSRNLSLKSPTRYRVLERSTTRIHSDAALSL